LTIEFCEDGGLQLAHDLTPENIKLSPTEWQYLQRLAELHGWPVAPMPQRVDLERAGVPIG